MAKLDYEIGARVQCTDGDCGKLLKVVVDPHTERIIDLVVAKGFLLTSDRVVPAEVVERTTDGDIYLELTGEALQSYPEYRDLEFTEPAPAVQAGHYGRGDVRCWQSTYRLACQEPVIPMVRHQVDLGVDADLAVIERGTPIKNNRGTLGHVDHLLADASSGKISHLVVRKGLFPYYPILPISEVKSVSGEAIIVDLTEKEVDELVRYRNRNPEDIQAEVVDRMADLGFDLDKVQVEVMGNVVQLTGWVPSVAAKRHAEAIAREVEGVIDVENMLDTDTSIVAGVIHALMTDPRTEVSAIEVSSEEGVVTLSGTVDNALIRTVAGQIAADQPGVVSVKNELEVEADEYSPRLSVRSFRLTTWSSESGEAPE